MMEGMSVKCERIILLVETLTMGGAETFVLRLADALQRSGYEVLLAVLRGDLVDEALARSIAPDVPIACFRPRGLCGLLKLDGAFQRLKFDFSLTRWLQQRWLGRLLQIRDAQLVHSHLMTSDLVAMGACAKAGVPWISTMHGDYLAFEETGGSAPARIPRFGTAASRIERNIGAAVCITDTQQIQIARLMPDLAARGRVRKIYNGYPRLASPERSSAPPTGMGSIPGDALVVGMVARGIRQKGWDVLVEAVRLANVKNAWLVLVGDGPHIAELRRQALHERIVFTGAVLNPLDYIARFDIACLPSRFPSESLPTVIIEYLRQGKPVIATRIGEIAAMLRVGTSGAAGLTIELGAEEAMAQALADGLRALAADPVWRAQLSRAARRAFEPFDMQVCLRRYESLYAEVVNG